MTAGVEIATYGIGCSLTNDGTSAQDLVKLQPILYVGMEYEKGRELIGLRVMRNDGGNQRFTPEAQISKATVRYGTIR